jgi:hypothetical protein
LHFEYLLGEITVHELSGVVVPVFEIVWKQDMSGKTNDWMNIVIFIKECNFPTALLLWMGNSVK